MKQNYTILIIITHKYIPFKPNVHENSELKVIDLCVINEANINDGYLSVTEGKERWKAFKRIENLTALVGYDNRKEVILPKIVDSQ